MINLRLVFLALTWKNPKMKTKYWHIGSKVLQSEFCDTLVLWKEPTAVHPTLTFVLKNNEICLPITWKVVTTESSLPQHKRNQSIKNVHKRFWNDKLEFLQTFIVRFFQTFVNDKQINLIFCHCSKKKSTLKNGPQKETVSLYVWSDKWLNQNPIHFDRSKRFTWILNSTESKPELSLSKITKIIKPYSESKEGKKKSVEMNHLNNLESYKKHSLENKKKWIERKKWRNGVTKNDGH